MGQVSLSETNEDMIARIAGQNERAGAVLGAMLAVGAESSAHAATPSRRPFFEYMMLVAMRQGDVTPDKLLVLHDHVCAGNPTLTAALTADAFASRSNHLSETARRAAAGQPYGVSPMTALQRLRANYGYFDSELRPTVVSADSPARTMGELTGSRSIGPATDWAQQIRRPNDEPEVGPPVPPHLRRSQYGQAGLR